MIECLWNVSRGLGDDVQVEKAQLRSAELPWSGPHITNHEAGSDFRGIELGDRRFFGWVEYLQLIRADEVARVVLQLQFVHQVIVSIASLEGDGSCDGLHDQRRCQYRFFG